MDREAAEVRTRRWTYALAGVSVVAVAITVVALANLPADDQPATVSLPRITPLTTTETFEPPPTIVTSPPAYPTDIPGCDTVEPPETGEMFGFATFGGVDSYDNPKFPWFSARKAVAMSDALKSAIKAPVELRFASPTQSLLFGPIWAPDPSQIPPEYSDTEFGGSTSAYGDLRRGTVEGSLSVQVQQTTQGPPPCVAGEITSRTAFPDGAIVDIHDTWTESDGRRALSRNANAYLPDGTSVYANVTDARPLAEPRSEQQYSGELPLTVDELTSLVLTPGIRVTAPIPPETGPLPVSCSNGGDSRALNLTRQDLERLNSALNEYWQRAPIDGIVFDRPIGSLQLGDYDDNEACFSLSITSPGRESDVNMSITGDHELPTAPDEYDPSYDSAPDATKFLANGSVITYDDSESTSVSMGSDGAAESRRHRSIAVTYPNGVQIRLSTSGSGTLLTFEELETIATAPGFQL
ncbi:hypothetical protein JGU71_19440 [Antrihabitans sp. YC3-6]|uniref:Uncharacterized protein n=1 Tax=Antrihabitans stalagmiti TaxID=2799499 RepID=A0A934NTK4_9NOCA|nr:hypothetical protein [Antrihabitans stalagmiti]MBJ8341065.1 hypothetical protein [Antrihabitans stalagmiti]